MYKGYYKKDNMKIKIIANEKHITEISFIKNNRKINAQNNINKDRNENVIIEECKEQLKKYFEGELKEFKINYSIKGTEFEQIVWKELLNVKYGTTISYKQLAQRIERPKAVRAVANAVGRNKIGIIIPCHRIIGSNGKLTGYAGGIENKKYLLELEKFYY